MPKTQKSVLHVMPAWARCGSTSVFQDQLEYLRSRDYSVHELFFAPLNYREMGQGKGWEQTVLDENPSAPNVVSRAFLWPKRREEQSEKVAQARKKMYASGICGQFVNFHCGALGGYENEIDRLPDVEFALVNHAFTMSHVRRLYPNVPVVMETHDIQCVQMRQREELSYHQDFANNLSFEAGWWKMADYLVSLNPDENGFILEASGVPGAFVPPPVIESVAEPKYETLGALLAAEGGAEGLRDLEQVDLLLMGDWHPLNVEAFRWFFRSVLPLVRQKADVSVAVVGRIVEKLGDEIDQSGVRKIGFLKDLANIQDFAKVLVLPDQGGTGISIKLREALAVGACFAPTAVAMRGVPGDAGGWPMEPRPFAEDILSLVSSEAARETRRALGAQLRSALDWDGYVAHWDAAVAGAKQYNKIRKAGSGGAAGKAKAGV